MLLDNSRVLPDYRSAYRGVIAHIKLPVKFAECRRAPAPEVHLRHAARRLMRVVQSQNRMANDSNAINPRALAQQLEISLSELAQIAGVSRRTLSAKPLGKKGSEALASLVSLLILATEIAGSLDRALLWFKYAPIMPMGSKTALEHIMDGNIAGVTAYLESVSNQVPA